jgi:hypothetical protein
MGRSFAITLLALAAPLALPADPGDPGEREPDGLLVLGVAYRDRPDGAVMSERAMVADPRTGATRSRLLEGGALCHGPVLAIGDRVVVSAHRGRRSVAHSLPLDLTGPGRAIGAADQFMSSSSPGRLWVARVAQSRRGMAFRAIREVDGAGRPHRLARRPLPAWGMFEGGVAGRLLLGRGLGLRLWDPATARTELRIRRGTLVAAGESRFAWCAPGCGALRLWRPDATSRLEPPAGVEPRDYARGQFTRGGGRLAVPVTAAGRSRVAVLDLATSAWTVVAGGRLAGYRSMAWSPSGRWLYFTGGERRLLAWRVGAERAIRLPLRPGGTVMSVATAAAYGPGSSSLTSR